MDTTNLPLSFCPHDEFCDIWWSELTCFWYFLATVAKILEKRRGHLSSFFFALSFHDILQYIEYWNEWSTKKLLFRLPLGGHFVESNFSIREWRGGDLTYPKIGSTSFYMRIMERWVCNEWVVVSKRGVSRWDACISYEFPGLSHPPIRLIFLMDG